MEIPDDSAAPDAPAPVGSGDYVVKQGECVSSIAYEHGHLVETILSDPANQDLKNARQNYHVLLPGDRLTVPPIRVKQVIAETDKNHQFQLQGPAEIFRVRLLDLDEKPRANLQYKLIIEHLSFSGKTDSQGTLKHSIPPNARQGRLILGIGDDVEEIDLHLGDLDPKEAITGAQSRLTNLGFDCGAVDGVLGPRTRNAIKRFQRHNQLDETGELDAATTQALESKHGS